MSTNLYGETSRALGGRPKEHATNRGPLTVVGELRVNEGHNMTGKEAIMLDRVNFWPRKNNKAIEIRERQPASNLDSGYNFPAIFMELLSITDRVISNRMLTNVSRGQRKVRRKIARIRKGILTFVYDYKS